MPNISNHLAALSAVASIAFAGASALAGDAAYVGTWASDLGQCQTPQNVELAPLVIAGDRYDQHDTHCEFKSVTGATPGWTIKADCIVEGAAQLHDFTFTISGDELTIKDEAGTTHLLKCPE